MKKFVSLMVKKHEHGLVHTGFINDAIDRIIFSGINKSDISVIESSLSFLRQEIERDCGNEETYLYPIFSGNVFHNRIEKLKKEHRELKSNIDSLFNKLCKLKENDNEFGIVFELKNLLRQFNNIFIGHFLEEKNLLLTLAVSSSHNSELENNLMINMPDNAGLPAGQARKEI